MNTDLLRKGFEKPTKVPEYVYRRLLDYRSGRITFDHNRARGKASVPEFSKDLFGDVVLLESGLTGYTAEKSLETGCGFGRLTPWIARYSEDHHAIEPEEKLIEDAKRLYPSVTFHTTLAHEIPYGNDEFDLIVTWEVLQHVPDAQIRDVIAELERVVNDDSRVVVSEK